MRTLAIDQVDKHIGGTQAQIVGVLVNRGKRRVKVLGPLVGASLVCKGLTGTHVSASDASSIAYALEPGDTEKKG